MSRLIWALPKQVNLRLKKNGKGLYKRSHLRQVQPRTPSWYSLVVPQAEWRIAANCLRQFYHRGGDLNPQSGGDVTRTISFFLFSKKNSNFSPQRTLLDALILEQSWNRIKGGFTPTILLDIASNAGTTKKKGLFVDYDSATGDRR
jgi:hypothetical protein